MTRLIDADALRRAIEEVEDNYDGYEPNDLGKFMSKVDDLIDEAPTVVEPGRPEGKWLITWYKSLFGTWNNFYEYRCSECNRFSRESKYLYQWRPRFCPKCGAKMVDEVRLEDKVGG